MLTASGATILLSGTMIEVIGTNLGDTGSAVLRDGSVNVSVSNSHGSDSVQFSASQVGSIEFLGGSGKNTFTNATSLTGYLYGGSGDNTLTGGSGLDFLVATSSGTNTLDAGSGFEILEAVGGGTNNLNGGSGYDTMLAFAGDNHFVGGTGYDCILAFGGQNVVDGGPGSATVYSFSTTDEVVPSDRMTVVRIGY